MQNGQKKKEHKMDTQKRKKRLSKKRHESK